MASPSAEHQDAENGTTIASALRWAIPLLAARGAHAPRLDAEVLLAHVLATSRPYLIAHRSEPLPAAAARRFRELVMRRSRGEPVAYLVGERAFYDVDLVVDDRVLIPRPETEMLVEEALAWCWQAEGRCQRVADVGTGSGALAVTLARHLVQARVWAVDCSSAALAVAAHNVARYGLAERVFLVCGDLLAALSGPLDLIVANLPYVPAGRLPRLETGVRDYEPHDALDGGPDGLEVIRRLLPEAAERLGAPGLLLLEIDEGQGAAVAAAAHAHLPTARISVHRDYAGLERMVRIERAPAPSPQQRS
ncbi:MAG TPA: peptide chain release factor N(5)-glutamine methyltransferase [Chloroflexi bacterium]|jgi:release factor glutamine methyltransferase|nr:peptide chain release factor N(5)-glutamine methyltransferase [Chloroflexota bacterium]